MKHGNLLRYLIAVAAGAVLAFTVMAARGIFAEDRTQEIMRLLSDAFFVSGVVLAAVGGILFASNGGLFDMFGFAALLFFGLFKRNVSERKYKDFYEYREAKKGKKRSVAYLLLVGIGYIALAALFLLLYYKV